MQYVDLVTLTFWPQKVIRVSPVDECNLYVSIVFQFHVAAIMGQQRAKKTDRGTDRERA